MEKKLFQWRGHVGGRRGGEYGSCNMSHNSTIPHTISPRSFRREQTSNMCIRVHARFRHCFINTRSGSCLLSETKSRNRSRKYRGLYRILSRGGGGIVKIEGIPAPSCTVYWKKYAWKTRVQFPFFDDDTMILFSLSLSLSHFFLNSVNRIVESIFGVWFIVHSHSSIFFFLYREFNIV